MRGYFIGWHREHGMVIRARDCPGPAPDEQLFTDPALGRNLAAECWQVYYLQHDGKIWPLRVPARLPDRAPPAAQTEPVIG